MYKPSRYLNKLNHSINDHFLEDFLVVESEFKRGHEKYKLPPKTNLNFNISSSDPSQNLNNITNKVLHDNNINFPNNHEQNNIDSKTVVNYSPFKCDSQDIQTVLKEKLYSTSNTNQAHFDYIENKIVFENIKVKHSEKVLDLQKEFDEVTANFTLHKLIFDKNLREIITLINSIITITIEFKSDSKLTEKLINFPDLRRNSPLMLAIILKNHFKDICFLPIIRELLQNKGNIKVINSFSISPLEEAVSKNDIETIVLIMDEIYKRKITKIKTSKEKLSNILLNSSDIYFDLKWKFDSPIPLISSLAPSDTCRIWKIGENLRLDTTFDDYKKLKIRRKNLTYLFIKKGKINEIFKLSNDDKSYFDPFEPFDDDEKILIINDVLNQNKIKGEFKINNCHVIESRSLLGNLQYETIDGWKAKKYDVEINSSVKIFNRFKYEFKNLNKNSYFNEKFNLNFIKELVSNEYDIKKSLSKGDSYIGSRILKTGLDSIEKDKDKKLKATVWITENFPFKSSFLINLVNKLSSTNEFFIKIKEFLNQENIKSILEKNGFPIKIKIPFTFLLNVEILFSNVKEIPYSKENEKLFEIPSNYKKISRKIGENLVENHKKRLIYANFSI